MVLVVNCSQIFCTFAVETTDTEKVEWGQKLWIALKFFVLLQSKQQSRKSLEIIGVVNCSQIFCTFAVETTLRCKNTTFFTLWIALKFFVLLQSKQRIGHAVSYCVGCELLSNFLYFCSRNNMKHTMFLGEIVVNCSQIFCTFAVETTKCLTFNNLAMLWIALKFFVLLQSKQRTIIEKSRAIVVNCSQIFCTFAVETTGFGYRRGRTTLWIALKFFVLLQSKQLRETSSYRLKGCELLSNFLYFCSRNNSSDLWRYAMTLWIALKFFVLLQSKQPDSIAGI